MINDATGRSDRDPPGEAPRRFALTLHYRGDAFHGWQLQPEVPTVQGAVESVIERITGEHRTVVGSGRTDTGVHATGQVAAVDLPARWTASALRGALNALLPRSIWIAEVRRVPPGFHPRYDARRRSYEYRLGTRDDAASPFRRDTCWPLDEIPDPALLNEAAGLIAGERSFRRFAKAGQPERGDRCRVIHSEWKPLPELGHGFRITADRYLHRMVRYLVGTMVEIAIGRRDVDELVQLLDDPETELRTSPPAPPQGLFLAAVEYPDATWTAFEERDPPHPDDWSSVPDRRSNRAEPEPMNASRRPRE